MVADQTSPYMQKLANSHVVPKTNGSSRQRRPMSAMAANRRPTSALTGTAAADKPRIDAKFIADPDLWDPETPHDSSFTKRPTSAPVYKR